MTNADAEKIDIRLTYYVVTRRQCCYSRGMGTSTVLVEKSDLTPQEFSRRVNLGAQATLGALAEFFDDDALQQLITLEVCRRHIMHCVEHGLAQDELGLSKFLADLEFHLGKLVMKGAS